MQFTNLKISKFEYHAIESASSERPKNLEGKKYTFLYEWVQIKIIVLVHVTVQMTDQGLVDICTKGCLFNGPYIQCMLKVSFQKQIKKVSIAVKQAKNNAVMRKNWKILTLSCKNY